MKQLFPKIRKKLNPSWELKINIRKRILNIVIILLAWIVIALLYYFLFFVHWARTKCFLDDLVEPGFAVGVSSALFEDLIVYLLLTPLVVYLTTKSLWEYDFYEKVQALVNSKKARDKTGLSAYIKKSVSPLMAYNSQIDFTIRVSNYSSSHSAYKLFIEAKQTITNICRDKDFILEKDYKFFVHPSDIDVDGDHGLVTFLQMKNLRNNEISPPIIDGNNVWNLKSRFEQPINLNVPQDGEVQIILQFNLWSKTHDCIDVDEKFNWIWNYLFIDRFAENINTVIINDLNRPLNFATYITRSENNGKISLTCDHEGVILPGQPDPHVISREMSPKEEVRIFFYKP